MFGVNLAGYFMGKAIMKTTKVLVVRIYITESSHLLESIMNYLKNEAKLRGVTVFRAISGFGETGEQTASFMALSLDLPLAIDFFDIPSKVEPALEHLSKVIKPEHMIFWEASAVD